MGTTALLTLPSGLWYEGVNQRDAVLRPLCGQDEVFMLEAPAHWSLAQRVTLLLTRCLTALGTLSPIPPALAAALSVGDREALLLKLRALTYGSRLDGVLSCAHCAARLDLELRVEDLILPPYAQPAPFYETTVTTEAETYSVRFRLPNGADQDALALSTSAAPEVDLLQRCLAQVVAQGAVQDTLPAALVEPIGDAMLEVDPQAELRIDMTCPTCGQAFSVLFDAPQFFLQEIANRGRRLYHEVHTLAFYYHWSEADILSLPFARRQMYLQLLEESLSGGYTL